MQVSLSSEINVLGHHPNRLSERDRHARDFTRNSLQYAMREVIAGFPVYRTYSDGDGVTERDRAIIDTAVSRAKRKNPVAPASAEARKGRSLRSRNWLIITRALTPHGGVDRDSTAL